ncbi:hypothetical protein N7454_005293 [Penicillium verhagenii]|nr:hypothetical protein N7454_005293 [Penicillium verhagenii]
MSEPRQDQTIGVIGPAGFGGSYLCVELLRRGHAVIGLSRNPESFGAYPGYTPRRLDIESASIEGLARHFRDIDVLVSQYGPHTQGAGALQYKVVRKMILAVKLANIKYFVFVGGAGSLLVPTTHDSLADHPSFFLSYRRQMAESDAHVQYMEERLGPIGEGLRVYRNARLAVKSGKATTTDLQTIEIYEDNVRKNDRASDYIKAGRAALLFFEGEHVLSVDFCPRTGSYEIAIDYVPLKGVQSDETNVLDGRLTGISAADLAAAIVDEIESPKLLHKHWTASADLSNDTAYPCYVTAKDIQKHL